MPLRSGDGYVIGALCVIDRKPRELTPAQLELLEVLSRQVTDQLEARRARLTLARERNELKRLADRLQIVFDSMTEGVVVQDANGVAIVSNPAAQRILGLPPEELLSRLSSDPRWRVVRENGRPMPQDEIPATLSRMTGKPIYNTTIGVHRPDDRLVWVCINCIPQVVDGRVVEVVTTFHDVTAVKEATDRASQQERLATVGTLAAGVGHEINNPLAYIMANVDFALEELARTCPPELRLELDQVLREAREGADRIRQIVKGLRALAREDVVLQGVDLRTAVEASLSMAAHEVKHKATLVQLVDERVSVLADDARLTQVLVNLTVNAAQAFEKADPSANRITISSLLRNDNRVSIVVADNGPGIPQSIIRRIFDPFFTTKPIGMGTGLGLSVSRHVIELLGGELQVSSIEGEGATFTIVLPTVTACTQVSKTTATAGGPRARIMIIDDEPSVLNALRRILGREHDVVGYSDPREALTALGSGNFELILCDLMMPYLSGPEVFAKAKLERPDLTDRFVFITGGVTNPVAQEFLAQVPNERMEKPFASEYLLQLARRYAQRGASTSSGADARPVSQP